jgi:sugar/nucleoside kinase (ribokinase family)
VSKPIVFYGDLVSDVVMHVERLPIEAERVQNIRSISIEPGGAGNSLIVAARLGAQAVALGTIGEDANGEQVYAALLAEGVQMHYVQRGAGSINMTVLVMVDDAGQHVFLVHTGCGDELVLGPDVRKLLTDAAAFFVPGYALHEPRVGTQALEALALARAAGLPVFSDLGPIVADDSLRDAALSVLGASQFSFLTEGEALTLARVGEADDAARWMLAHGAKVVVLKRGAQGCSVYAGAAAAPVRTDIHGLTVTVVDTSGAGDSFAAGFMVHYLEHGDAIAAARFANAVGAAKVQKLGTGRQMPTRAEIDVQWQRSEML